MYEREDVLQLIRMVEAGNLRLGSEVGVRIAGPFASELMEVALEVAEVGRRWGHLVVLEP